MCRYFFRETDVPSFNKGCIPKTKYDEDKSTEIKMSSEILEKHSLAQLLATDEITLTILPQKKGFFRKHVEYEIKSSKHKSQVCTTA